MWTWRGGAVPCRRQPSTIATRPPVSSAVTSTFQVFCTGVCALIVALHLSLAGAPRDSARPDFTPTYWPGLEIANSHTSPTLLPDGQLWGQRGPSASRARRTTARGPPGGMGRDRE